MPSVIDKVVTCGGDLAKLTPDERAIYYKEVCESVGLNPLTEPFKYITLNGKLTLYATKAATEQLRKLNGISLTIISTDTVGDVYIVRVRATDKDNRVDESTGAVSIAGLKSDALANAIMKTETKAKRRVTLSISGLGYLDESELESIPGATLGPAVTLPEKEPVKAKEEKAEVKTEEKKEEKTEDPPTPPVEPPRMTAPPAEIEVTGEVIDFNVIIMGSPRKKNGKEEYGVSAVIADPAEYEGEVELISPAKFKDLLVNGAALQITGAINNDKQLLASSVKSIDVDEPALISDALEIGKQAILQLNGESKFGRLPYKGEVVESYFAYPVGRANTILFGDSLKGYVSGDVVNATITDIVEKDGKTLVIVSACEKAKAA